MQRNTKHRETWRAGARKHDGRNLCQKASSQGAIFTARPQRFVDIAFALPHAGSSNRNQEPRRTKLAARAAEWFWHAAGYIRFSAETRRSRARGACADIIHVCAIHLYAHRIYTYTHVYCICDLDRER